MMVLWVCSLRSKSLTREGNNEAGKVEMKKIMNKWANLSTGVTPLGWGYSNSK